MARVDSFLKLVVEQGGSDLHLHAGNVPIIRHDGELKPIKFREISETECRKFVYEILSEEQKRILDDTKELDIIYSIEGTGRFRVNVFNQNFGLGAVFRIVPSKVPTIDQLKLPPVAKKVINSQNGLILVTGPTGSGKSTTLAAMIHEINATSCRHIISIEDPVEFIHKPIKSFITHRQVGEHTDSFASALKSALRESPDVVVVGEMRDLTTVMLAVNAAETGVLVMGTLHTNSATKAIDRILDVVPIESRDQIRGALAVLLRAVFAQHLVKRAGGRGRMALMEVFINNIATANMIRENKIHQLDGYLDTASGDGSGMQSMDGAIYKAVCEGQIALETGLRLANDPVNLRKKLNIHEV